MKPEAQRIAIAEACGIRPPFKHEKGERGQDWQVCKTIWTIPDYLSDLNAMHEAEKALTKGPGCKPWWDYCDWLKDIVPQNVGNESHVHATAAQRAEAFLRTLNLWTNDTPC